MLSNVRSFVILRWGEGLTSFNKNNSFNFSCEKKEGKNTFRDVYFLATRQKTISSSSLNHKFSIVSDRRTSEL